MREKEPIYLDARELAERWGTSMQTLANRRARGYGPAYTKIGRMVRYFMTSIVEMERRGTVNPERRA